MLNCKCRTNSICSEMKVDSEELQAEEVERQAEEGEPQEAVEDPGLMQLAAPCSRARG